METGKISKTLKNRLPGYLAYLKGLPEEEQTISATAIARDLGLGEVQVRKDLAKVSAGGRCRTGRSRQRLIRDMEAFLESAGTATAVLVGASAGEDNWRESGSFDLSGVQVVGFFDLDATGRGGAGVYGISRLEYFCRCYDVHIGIVQVPQQQAQAVCDGLIACGVQEIWNGTGAQLRVPEHITVRSAADRGR